MCNAMRLMFFYFQKSKRKEYAMWDKIMFNIFYFSNPKMYVMYVRKKMFNVFSFSNPKMYVMYVRKKCLMFFLISIS